MAGGESSPSPVGRRLPGRQGIDNLRSHTGFSSNTCCTMSQLQGLEQVTDHLWISVFSFVKWREYPLSGSAVVRFKERSMMTNLKPWQAINTWYFKKCILIVTQIPQTRKDHRNRGRDELFGAFETGSWVPKSCELWFIFLNNKYMCMLFFLPSEQKIEHIYVLFVTYCLYFLFLYFTACLGNFPNRYMKSILIFFIES